MCSLCFCFGVAPELQGFLPLFWGFDIGIPRLLGGQNSAKSGENGHLTVAAFVWVVVAYSYDNFICFFGFYPDCERGQPRSVGALSPFYNAVCIYFNAIVAKFLIAECYLSNKKFVVAEGDFTHRFGDVVKVDFGVCSPMLIEIVSINTNSFVVLCCVYKLFIHSLSPSLAREPDSPLFNFCFTGRRTMNGCWALKESNLLSS